jgi:DNA-binding NarL/FixJ family response regulator
METSLHTLPSAHGERMPTARSSLPCSQVKNLAHVGGLSSREHEVLALLAVGADDKTIAYELRVSLRTVRAHITALFLKLRVGNRTEVALLGQFAHLRTCDECWRSIRAERSGSPNKAS